jgi:hypothetical protein
VTEDNTHRFVAQSSFTVEDLKSARPARNTGAPARSRSHYEAILQLMRERGPQGVLGSELYSRPDLYGRSPRNRISELRRDGHLIEGKARGSADWFYRLIRDNAGHAPSPSSSADWYERTTGHARPKLDKRNDELSSLPLFFGGQR